APPDVAFGGMLFDDELVGSGARGVLAGADYHRTEMGDAGFAAEYDLFIERRAGQVPVGAVQIGEAVILQAVIGGQLAGLGLWGRGKIEIGVHRQSLVSLRSPR